MRTGLVVSRNVGFALWLLRGRFAASEVYGSSGVEQFGLPRWGFRAEDGLLAPGSGFCVVCRLHEMEDQGT